MGACKNCSAKCLLIHGKQDDLISSKGFFNKIIIKDEFLDNLFIPPRFARRIVSLANKKVQIKDTSGRHWTVELSYVNGALALGRGWRAFTLDHGIEISDVVLVRYISGSDFVCRIFGRSGCEKWQFPSASYNKSSRNSAVKDSSTSCRTGVNVNITQSNMEGRVKRKFFEDPCCILNRDIDVEPIVDRRCLFDLSEFEMRKTKPDCTNGSSSVQDVGCSNHAEREEQIHESSFIEDVLDFAAFEADMRIPCDDGDNISSKDGDNYGPILPESFPSTSAVSATEHKMKHAAASAGSSMEAQTAAFQDVSAGPSWYAQNADLKAQRAAFQGPPPEAQTADLKGQTAAFHGQTTTLRGQDAAKGPKESNPKGFGNERAQPGGSVKTTKNEHVGFNPKGFGGVGSESTAKKERNEFKPMGLGGSVENVKMDHKKFNPEGFGGSARILKEEMKFNPNSFGGSAQRVKKEQFNSKNFGEKHNANGGLHENAASSSYQALKRVKAEAVEFTQPPSPVTCQVTSDNNYLVLPKEFSTLVYTTKMQVEKKVVFLRDSAGRLWPLLWCRKGSLQVLTGWKSFRETNKIRTGNECVFALEDPYQGIIKVNVIEK